MYTVRNGGMGRGCFHLVAPPKELKQFWDENRVRLDTPQFDDPLQFPEPKREQIQNLVYRFNVIEAGQRSELDKKNFLEDFTLESITAVIYATNFCPDELSIEQYAAAIRHAFEEYNDSLLFDERIINLAVGDRPSSAHLAIICNQVALFKQLLIVNLDEEEENDK